MLGLIHRAALGLGPPQFRDLFPLVRNSRVVADAEASTWPHQRRISERQNMPSYLALSGFGLIPVYNGLPAEMPKVSASSKSPQGILLRGAVDDSPGWEFTFSPMARRT